MNTLPKPEVSVADPGHLLVNWSFGGCDSGKAQSANLHIGSDIFQVVFAEKEAKIRANPCLRHTSIELRVKFEGKKLWSHLTNYKKD